MPPLRVAPPKPPAALGMGTPPPVLAPTADTLDNPFLQQFNMPPPRDPMAFSADDPWYVNTMRGIANGLSAMGVGPHVPTPAEREMVDWQRKMQLLEMATKYSDLIDAQSKRRAANRIHKIETTPYGVIQIDDDNTLDGIPAQIKTLMEPPPEYGTVTAPDKSVKILKKQKGKPPELGGELLPAPPEKMMELSPGAEVFDPKSGRVIHSVPTKPPAPPHPFVADHFQWRFDENGNLVRGDAVPPPPLTLEQQTDKELDREAKKALIAQRKKPKAASGDKIADDFEKEAGRTEAKIAAGGHRDGTTGKFTPYSPEELLAMKAMARNYRQQAEARRKRAAQPAAGGAAGSTLGGVGMSFEEWKKQKGL